jgi:ferric-dicitrate binding protein FerR (iron transport regulator)
VSDEDLVSRLLRLGGPSGEPPAEVAARVGAAVLAVWRREVAARRRRRLLGWLASVGAFASGLVFLNGMRPPKPGAPLPVTRPADETPAATVEWADSGADLRVGDKLRVLKRIETGRARLALRLANGASLRVDVESVARLLPASAVALEAGAVYVDSENRSSHPVEVRSASGVVRDVGTQFEVRLVDGLLRVRVREGRVTWEGSRGAAKAGEELTVAPGRAPTLRPILGYGPEWDWVARSAPRFDIEGRPLGSFVEWVARQQGWRLGFERPELDRRARETRLHGSIGRLTPEAALDVVMSTTALGVRLDRGVLHVVDAERPAPRLRLGAVRGP